jgi:hypothetical protein
MAKGDPAREKVEVDIFYRHLAELGIPPPVEPDLSVT